MGDLIVMDGWQNIRIVFDKKQFEEMIKWYKTKKKECIFGFFNEANLDHVRVSFLKNTSIDDL